MLGPYPTPASSHVTLRILYRSSSQALFQELLPDLVRVLGKDHPETLATRGNIKHLTETSSGEHAMP
jgi:hypothetical protein